MIPDRRWPRSVALAERVAGVGILAIVIAVYGMSLAQDRWPPGHPWSGVTLVLLAGLSLAATRSSPSTRLAWIAGATLALIGAGMWLASALLRTA